MRSVKLLLVFLLALPVGARAQGKLNVVATTEDLGALAREVGGDRVSVTPLAKGYQDPHFVDPKPSFILAVSKADLLIVVGRELEIGWLPPLLTSSRNSKIQQGGNGYLDASLNVKILEIPTGQITRAMGDVHPLGNPHYWLEPGNGRQIRPGDPRQVNPAGAGQRVVFCPALHRFRRPPRRGRETMGCGHGALQRDEDCDVPPLVAQLHGAMGH
jgi:hypothetical protein